MGYYATTIVLDILLGVLAALIVAWFSRQREFRADAARAADGPQAADGERPRAPWGLDSRRDAQEPRGIGHQQPASGLMALFSSHPPIEERMARLNAGTKAEGLAGVRRQAQSRTTERGLSFVGKADS